MSHPLHQPTEAALRMESINRRAWSAPRTVQEFRRRKGWTDPGEQVESVGFRPRPSVWESSDGRRLSLADDTSDAWWFHLAARK